MLLRRATGADRVGDLEGLDVCSETIRRLYCDARVEDVFEIGGIPVGLGRTHQQLFGQVA